MSTILKNKDAKRKKTLSDWSLILGLLSFGCTSLALLIYLLLEVSDVIHPNDGGFLGFLVFMLGWLFTVCWIAAPIIALASLIIGIMGLFSWLIKKEKPTWKLLVALALSIVSIYGALYLLGSMM